ncbi:hypothetical protein N5079_32340 [Planotetraspora sp. A-T 1434]|uniref:hypothetical protein n=1 Tax=Planotetraspora sp. A-T 1434 TaxID=2979219 RepID=UPI0021C0C3AB|nr:hypothetical protein [Planotetraspora sp. A-T 1434]MCT9934907.1 hypothetical protein [Planotetraspora sp. A-T 1434]
MAELVPNPLYEAGIEAPYQHSTPASVWTGPSAKGFDAQLAHYRTYVRSSRDKILSDLQQELARTPREVTAEEPKTIIIRYGLP